MPIEFTSIPGATGETYQPPVLPYSTVYRRKATSTVNCESVEAYSNELQITVTESWFVPLYDESGTLIVMEDETIIPDEPFYDGGIIVSAQTINTGEIPTELVEDASPNFSPVSYKWWVSKFGPGIALKYVFDETGSTYQPPILYSNTWYARRGFDENDLIGSTPFIKITVLDNENQVYEYGILDSGVITGHTDGTVIYVGDTPSGLTNVMSAFNYSGRTVNDDPISYDWWFSLNGSDYNSIGDGTSEDYQPLSLSYSTWYKRKAIQSSYLSSFTNYIKITVLDGSNNEVLYEEDPFGP